MLLFGLLAAFALRLYRLDGQSLWYDEGVTAMLARLGPGELARWTANDIQPPLYYLQMAAWSALAGVSEFALRFPSVFWGVLAVPLLARLALRLAGRRPALLAALLATLHPLLLYYSQEARMYSLLVALVILLALALRRFTAQVQTGAPAGASLAMVIVTGTAAAYTHYFALFAFAGLGLVALGELWRGEAAGRWRRLGWLALAPAGVLLLYAPWLGVLFNRLAVDRSYWEGALKLNEALRAVAISFTSGEAVDEEIGAWLLLGYGLITLGAIGRLWQAGQKALVVGLLVWMAVPLAAVLALAMAVPKFNSRYVMVALPPLLLLWSAGYGLAPAQEDSAGRAPAGRLSHRTLDRLALLFLCAGMLYGVGNWFFDARFAKDDWRGVVQFLRPRLTGDEMIILVSGHALPVWRYYAPEIEPVALPAIDVLDVNALLTFANTGPVLKPLFDRDEGRDGVWYVGWQDEVVDPNQVVPVQLELGGREKNSSARYAGIELRRWSRVNPSRIALEPPIAMPLDIAFGDRLHLRGYRVMDTGDLLLFWQRAPGAEGDYRLALHSFAADGAPLAQPADRRPAGYNAPTFRWSPEEVVMGRIPAADWLGPDPQPGQYAVSLRLYEVGSPDRPLAVEGAADFRIDGLEVKIE